VPNGAHGQIAVLCSNGTIMYDGGDEMLWHGGYSGTSDDIPGE
jgi:hypothetical protein